MQCNPAKSANGFLAHSQNDSGGGVVELLSVHLERVAQRAAEFAICYFCNEQAFAAGLLHDLGKYSEQFLRRLGDPKEPSRDHWSAGALAAARCYKHLGAMPAMAIAGHHVGLCELLDHETLAKRVESGYTKFPHEFTETNAAALQARFVADGFHWPKVSDGLTLRGQNAADMLDVRMLFAALVDADFIETEAHFAGDSATPRRNRPDGPILDVPAGIAALDRKIAKLRAGVAGPLDNLRQELFDACAAAGKCQRTGLFTLSAPTGFGKTLAMLAFALRHCQTHGLRRIVLVMPFLNIIEQTAHIYREIFSPQNGFLPHTVLEHHSLANDRSLDASTGADDGIANARRLLAENWDAPVILTTSVQCLESLMANRPAPCRKLHRLARSVILFDEVQTLPPHLAVATLATLSRLADPDGPYRSSVVFATATQPAFDVLNERTAALTSTGWQPNEIATQTEPMYRVAAQRVRVRWRHSTPVLLADLAKELKKPKQVLCIVNLKRHALELVKQLGERGVSDVFHLSTNLCPAHRTIVLDEVRRRLANPNSPAVRLIATQCVEAGVDVDFPLVYRALAPLEAIAQAAGRCNRHGLRASGSVVVFAPVDERGLYPPGYEAAVQATETFLAGIREESVSLDDEEIINSPPRLREYFRLLYGLSGRAKSRVPDEAELLTAIDAGSFTEVARHYRLISQDAINVLVPFDRPTFAALSDEIRYPGRCPPGVVSDWMRRAAPHTVSLFRPKPESPIWPHLDPIQFSRRHEVEQFEASWFIALPGITYDHTLGMQVPDDDCLIA